MHRIVFAGFLQAWFAPDITLVKGTSCPVEHETPALGAQTKRAAWTDDIVTAVYGRTFHGGGAESPQRVPRQTNVYLSSPTHAKCTENHTTDE